MAQGKNEERKKTATTIRRQRRSMHEIVKTNSLQNCFLTFSQIIGQRILDFGWCVHGKKSSTQAQVEQLKNRQNKCETFRICCLFFRHIPLPSECVLCLNVAWVVMPRRRVQPYLFIWREIKFYANPVRGY